MQLDIFAGVTYIWFIALDSSVCFIQGVLSEYFIKGVFSDSIATSFFTQFIDINKQNKLICKILVDYNFASTRYV